MTTAHDDRQPGGAVVWPAARLAVPGLAGALAAGRFAVAGFAAFDPMAPFQPAPTVPETRPRDTVAVEDIGEPPVGLVYPGDF